MHTFMHKWGKTLPMEVNCRFVGTIIWQKETSYLIGAIPRILFVFVV